MQNVGVCMLSGEVWLIYCLSSIAFKLGKTHKMNMDSAKSTFLMSQRNGKAIDILTTLPCPETSVELALRRETILVFADCVYNVSIYFPTITYCYN